MENDLALADSHIHLFERGFIGPEGRSPAGGDEVTEYERYRQAFNIDTALVVGYEGENSYRGNNAYVRTLAREFPWVKPVAFVDHSVSQRDVAAWLDQGFYGLSVYATQAGEVESLAGLIARAAGVLAERKALISLNVSAAAYPELRTSLAAAPELRVLISHVGLPGKGAESRAAARRAVEELCSFSELPGVLVKASGFYAFTELLGAADVLPSVVERFGTERIVWGSDYPVVLSWETFEETLAHLSDIPEEARRAVLGDNLRKVLAQVELA